MTNVIQFKRKKVAVDKAALYQRAYMNSVIASVDSGSITNDAMKRITLYGIKYINLKIKQDLTREEVSFLHSVVELVKANLKKLTPNDWINVFPITKEFDGEKYCSKDYFYTMQTLNGVGLDISVGDRLDDVLWDYQNYDIRKFLVSVIKLANVRLKDAGEETLTEKFTREFQIPLYEKQDDGEIKQVWQKPNLTVIKNE